MPDRPRVCIVDDDEAVRDSLALLVGSFGFEAMVFASARDFLAVGEELDAVCVLLDMRMPGMSGQQCHADMRRRGIDVPAIFLTAHADVPSAVRAMRFGALDFLEKPLSDHKQLLDRLNQCVRLSEQRQARERESRQLRSRLSALTRREREIASAVAQGKANKVIAADFGISERTVEVHRSRAFHKLGVRSVAELIGLLSRESATTQGRISTVR